MVSKLVLIALAALAIAVSAHTRLGSKSNSSLQTVHKRRECPCKPPPLKCGRESVDPCTQREDYDGDDSTELGGPAPSGFRQESEDESGDDGVCDCGTDEDEDVLDDVPHIPKPGVGISDSFAPIEKWIDYYEEKDAADAVSMAARKAKSVTDQIKRSQHKEEMELRDSNEMIRMSVQGGLSAILAKEQRRKAAERDQADQVEQQQRMLRKASEEIEKVQRRAANVGPPVVKAGTVPEQAQKIVENAQQFQGFDQNAKAFELLKDMVKKAVEAEAGKKKA